MKYLLDSNICIHFLRGKYDIDRRLTKAEIGKCSVSEITLAELTFGAENSANPEANHKLIDQFVSHITILPILDAIPLYGREKYRLRKLGIMIGDFDLLIGCTAVEKDLIMVTENTREFERISNIRLENWVNRK